MMYSGNCNPFLGINKGYFLKTYFIDELAFTRDFVRLYPVFFPFP